MALRDHGKLLLFVLLVLVTGCLRALGNQDGGMFPYVCTAVLAYLMGNGVQAIRGKAPSPVIVPTTPEAIPHDVAEALVAHLGPALLNHFATALTLADPGTATPGVGTDPTQGPQS